MADRRAARVAVVGAVGGVGATTVACGLSLAWAVERGMDPWLVELDEARGDLGARWDLPGERTLSDLATVADGIDADHLARAAVTHRSGAVVLLAPRPGAPVDSGVVKGVLAAVEPRCPVVLDLGAAQGEAARCAARHASLALVVAPTSSRGARLARRLVEGILGQTVTRLVAVSTPSGDLSARSLARAVGVEQAGSLPRSRRQAATVCEGRWPRSRRRGLRRPLLSLADGIA